MATVLIHHDDLANDTHPEGEPHVVVPADIASLEQFRAWSVSPCFPERGRIDYLNGNIEVDMAAERVFGHGEPKSEIGMVLRQIAKRENLGRVWTDGIRVVNLDAELSCEPDVLFVSRDSFDNGHVVFAATSDARENDFLEVVGAPDLIVEVVSRSSVVKDMKRLPQAYFAAGVREYWLVDGRGQELSFQILKRGKAKFRAVTADSEGFLKSEVFSRRFRLTRHTDALGHWAYDLLAREV